MSFTPFNSRLWKCSKLGWQILIQPTSATMLKAINMAAMNFSVLIIFDIPHIYSWNTLSVKHKLFSSHALPKDNHRVYEDLVKWTFPIGNQYVPLCSLNGKKE